MAKEVVLIVDLDVVVYRLAAAVETRAVKCTYLPTGTNKEFANKTEMKAFLKSKNIDFEADQAKYVVENIQYAGDFSQCKKMIDSMLADMRDFVWADKTYYHLGASGNTMRQLLPLPTRYKSNREEMIRPVNLEKAKNYVRRAYNAFERQGLEADDTISIQAYEELAKGNYPIIATIDKDAYQSVGIQILDWLKKPWKLYSVPSLGRLYVDDNNAVKGDGNKFLAFQTLAGDPTDVYKPYELSKIKYGPKKAYDLLKDLKTEREVWQAVVTEYKRLYPTEFEYKDWQGNIVQADWFEMLDLYFKCAYMLRSKDDEASFIQYVAQYDVEVF